MITVEGTDKELMLVLAGSQSTQEALDCASARRFGLNLLPLDEPYTLACIPLYSSYSSTDTSGNRLIPALGRDGERWWASASNSLSWTPLRLWTFGADGKPRGPYTMPVDADGVRDLSLARSPLGLGALYSHEDEDAALTLRAYQQPVFTSVPKTRSARH